MKNISRIFSKAFTLTELLVVLVVIGILVLLATPKFSSVVSRTKKTEAKLILKQIYVLEESYWDEHDKYSNNLRDIGFIQEKLVTEGGEARYLVEIISATDSTFIATATAVVDINRNGIFNKWQIDHNKMLVEIQ